MNTIMRNPKRCIVLAISSLWMASAYADNAAVAVSVDANAGKHPISPYIYGVAPPSTGTSATTLKDLNTTVNRYGGNTSSSYNWQANASNHANDWFFESIAENSATAGELGDTFISATRSGNAEPMITIPMLDWVAKVAGDRSKLASFSQAKYGAQTGNDWQWFPDAGNGILQSTGQPVQNNDMNDASTPAGVNFQKSWVQHIIGKWGLAGSGGLKYYILDNEHSIWQGTHMDVHPVGATMDEIGQKMIDYGTMIRGLDANAIIIGPEEWGWSGYLLSGYDQQYGNAHGWQFHPDKDAHGGMDYMPWLLDHLHKSEQSTGKRALDVFSLHIYPQGGEFSDDDSTGMQQLRNQSTRSLWDPNYVDQSWIGAPVYLIPRMKSWVSTYYPGLKTGITEYNWGDEGHINGATTQADIFGIFGREGLDYATRWTTPDPTSPTYKAMKMYRNYDGSKHGFGDNSISASAPNPDNLSAFAATRSSDGALTVMVISKYLTGNTPVTVNLANFAAGGSAQEWQLTSANAINQLASVPVSSGKITVTVPAQSISLFVVPKSGGGNNPPTAAASASPTSGIATLTVHFSSAGSADSDGTIASYRWTFGDGKYTVNPNPTHQFTTPGNYNVQLTVTDNLGATGSASVLVSVIDGSGPIAAPTNLVAKGAAGGKVTMTWKDNSNNEQGFAIQRKDPGASSYVEVGRVGINVTSFAQSGLASGLYYYRVYAFNTTSGRVSGFTPITSARVP